MRFYRHEYIKRHDLFPYKRRRTRAAQKHTNTPDTLIIQWKFKRTFAIYMVSWRALWHTRATCVYFLACRGYHFIQQRRGASLRANSYKKAFAYKRITSGFCPGPRRISRAHVSARTRILAIPARTISQNYCPENNFYNPFLGFAAFAEDNPNWKLEDHRPDPFEVAQARRPLICLARAEFLRRQQVTENRYHRPIKSTNQPDPL